jgi:hypothetical protein
MLFRYTGLMRGTKIQNSSNYGGIEKLFPPKKQKKRRLIYISLLLLKNEFRTYFLFPYSA